MQTLIQCSSLYTFIDILGARDGAGVGSFHHYVPILCITTDVLTSEVVQKYHLAIKVGRLTMGCKCLFHPAISNHMMVYNLFNGLVIHLIGYDVHVGRHHHHCHLALSPSHTN